MNREEIMRILPHRDNMLLLDEVVEEGGVSHGKYQVRGDEWFLSGHFPGNPVVPGVILCEILAQSTCALLADKLTGEETPHGVSSPGNKPAGLLPMYTGMDGVRFKAPVKPGDLFETECRITRVKHPFYFAEGVGRVGDKICVKAEFSFALVKK